MYGARYGENALKSNLENTASGEKRKESLLAGF
jgi:hypothetical protein